MTKAVSSLLAFLAFASGAPVRSAEPFDPGSLQKAVAGEHTQVLVLGSPHLMNEPEHFDTKWLDPLLVRLGDYKPDVIVVEALPGEAVHALTQYQSIYPGVAEMFAAKRITLGRETSAALGTSSPEAEASARRVLEKWPGNPSPTERRRLAALLIAAGDLNSALLQWLKLEESQRQARDGISETAAAHLKKASTSRNETVSIAVRLAQRMGHDRIYSMDDQSETDLVFPVIEKVGEAEKSGGLKAVQAKRQFAAFPPMKSADSVLAAFRTHNSDRAGKLDAERQWLARLESGEHQAIHRMRIAAWETRNLRMAANIREVSGRFPGGKMLVLVGSAHKPYLDAYLSGMADVRVVAAADVIG